MSALLNKNVVERALWTGVQAVVALAITDLADIRAWWAAPIALLLSAVKTNVVDKLAKPKPEEVGP